MHERSQPTMAIKAIFSMTNWKKHKSKFEDFKKWAFLKPNAFVCTEWLYTGPKKPDFWIPPTFYSVIAPTINAF